MDNLICWFKIIMFKGVHNYDDYTNKHIYQNWSRND